MKIQIQVETPVQRTVRVRQLESLFEVPATEKLSVSINGELPIESKEWNIGLIVGPSGSGKSLTLNRTFGIPIPLEWGHFTSTIDDFEAGLSMEKIVETCQAVGFNTIPAWMRPYTVLSNGERFRAELARRLLHPLDPISIDEFTSVVDRQVAKVASFSVAKYIRKNNRKLVAASCHYDIINWLEPDWIFEPASQSFSWRSLRGRPPISCEVTRLKYEAWHIFAPFHYMTTSLNKAARCYGLYANGCLASMCGVLYRPHSRVHNLMGFTRMVTLPDWQGLGLAMVLANTVGSAYSALGRKLHSYPNHPAWVRSYLRNNKWVQVKEHGDYSPRRGNSSTVGGFGGKTCAVFAYIGESMDKEIATKLVAQGA